MYILDLRSDGGRSEKHFVIWLSQAHLLIGAMKAPNLNTAALYHKLAFQWVWDTEREMPQSQEVR